MRNRTRDQFLNPQRTREPGPGKAAEVDRAERTIAGANMADYMKSTTDGDPYLESLRASSNG